MRTGTLVGAAAALLVVSTWQPARAQQVDSPVVARVGSRTITAAELERRLASVPPFQLRTLGKTPEEIRRAFLERVLVREALFAEGAMAEKLTERDEVQERLRSILRSALLTQVRVDVARDAPISEAEMKAYYDANRARFNAPARLALWRILVDKREEAVKIIEDAKKDLTPKHWTDLAREKSVDKATNMRGGNLGFVAPDGTTAEPGVRVDTALFTAASEVKDAELVPEPVKEGERWAVVWRRQSMRSVERTLESESASIRQILSHSKTEERIKGMVEKLRTEQVAELHPELTDLLEITSSGEIQPMHRPGSLASSRRPAAAPPAPVPGPGGLR